MAAPVEDIETYWTPEEKRAVEHRLKYSFVGALDTVREGLKALIEETAADEVMATARIFEPAAGLYSLDILARAR
jgi:alkanesulfonate monooxygenase SsuD/methylene tetrahydromethanopterin reductase-like flavin-dependent oxidoreductase (luciferase family)